MKPGDLAVILKSDAYPESVGWHVTAKGPAQLAWMPADIGEIWWIEHAPLGRSGNTTTSIPLSWLRRIPPLSELGDVDHKEELHA